jgi:A/G-specific adenine glycosylase
MDRVGSSKEARYRRVILGWFRRHPREFPWRRASDPYAVLISEILLQRTRGENAVGVYEEFMRRWPTPKHLARAQHRSILFVIRSIGLAKRAALLQRLGKALEEVGGVPSEPIELSQLPGVGPYAAYSVPVFAFDRPLPVVDWVIARVLRRYFGLEEGRRPNTDRSLWKVATGLASRGRARELWLGTLDFGAAVCKPRPLCETCPLRLSCTYYGQWFE